MNEILSLDFSRFLQCDFESVILPRLKFFHKNNVKFDACENGLTPITSLLNHAYHIEKRARRSIQIEPQVIDRRVHLDNILQIILFFQDIGVSHWHELLNIHVSAVDLLSYLGTFFNGDVDVIMNELGWHRHRAPELAHHEWHHLSTPQRRQHQQNV